MYVLFNQTTLKNRRNGARGGRAFARNQRLRQLLRTTDATGGARGAAARDGPRGQPLAGSPISLARGCLCPEARRESRLISPDCPTAEI